MVGELMLAVCLVCVFASCVCLVCVLSVCLCVCVSFVFVSMGLVCVYV